MNPARLDVGGGRLRWHSVNARNLLVGFVICLSLAVACGGSPAASKPSPTANPADVVTKFFASVQAKDCATAFGLLVDPVKSRIVNGGRICLAYSGTNALVSVTVGAATITSPTAATVPVTQTTAGGTSKVVASLTKAGSDWRISDLKTG